MIDLRMKTIINWCKTNSNIESRWYRPWHRGYEEACRDILLLLEQDVYITTLLEYKAIEGLTNEL